jgi:predicted small secreted protein
MKKRIMLVLGVTVMSLLLAACNTVSGIGKDVKKVGEAVEGVGKK